MIGTMTLFKDRGAHHYIMTINCSDSFNGVLKGARSLPIKAFVARTFYRLVNCSYHWREKSKGWATTFSPRVRGTFEIII